MKSKMYMRLSTNPTGTREKPTTCLRPVSLLREGPRKGELQRATESSYDAWSLTKPLAKLTAAGDWDSCFELAIANAEVILVQVDRRITVSWA